MKRKTNTNGSCIVAGCDRPARARGVCMHCYHVVHRAVAAGKLTWEQAEQKSLVLPSRLDTPMGAAIEQITEGRA